MAPSRDTQGVQPLRQLLRGERLTPLPVERDHVRSRGYTFEEPVRLGDEHLLRGALVQVYFWHLDDLHGEEAPQPL
jgi:hypothetical protein